MSERTERAWQDDLPCLHDTEFLEESDDVRGEYRQLGALIQDIASFVPSGPAVDAWKARVCEAIARQRDELESSRNANERDFYRRLLDLGGTLEVEPLLDQALALIVEVTGASMAYLELRDDAGTPRYWKGHRLSDNDIDSIRASISRGIVALALGDGRTVETPSARLDERFADLGSVRDRQIDSVLCTPIGDPAIGVIYLQGRTGRKPFTAADRERLVLFATQLAPIADRLVRPSYQLDHTVAVRQRLACDEIVGRSLAVAEMLTSASQVASIDVGVLLLGPCGTGKSMLARVIHHNSPRHAGPFVELNCAAIPEPLLESELFGADRGAHSTATRRIAGKVGAAESGTLFLDEIGELSLGAQAKLLQLLETHLYYPLGSATAIRANVRILSATNADLEERVAARQFRSDLFYRLLVMPIDVPTLDARRDDIPELVERFVVDSCKRHRLHPLPVSRCVAIACQNATWPGNVRQLSHAIEAAVIRAHGENARSLFARHVFPKSTGPEPVTMRELTRKFQRSVLLESLERNEWNVTVSSRELDLARSHLHHLINEFGLRPYLRDARPKSRDK